MVLSIYVFGSEQLTDQGSLVSAPIPLPTVNHNMCAIHLAPLEGLDFGVTEGVLVCILRPHAETIKMSTPDDVPSPFSKHTKLYSVQLCPESVVCQVVLPTMI